MDGDHGRQSYHEEPSRVPGAYRERGEVLHPTRPRGSHKFVDKVRGFVSMWEKVQTESLFPGPFVWRFDDEIQPVRWEQVYPEELVFSPLDLSKTPVGHLLNLFAEVVTQHDLGWFSRSYVEGLHENIRREIEARITRDRSSVFEESNDRVLALDDARIGGSSDQAVPLDRPINLRGYREAWSR